jgi:hypothetical protein
LAVWLDLAVAACCFCCFHLLFNGAGAVGSVLFAVAFVAVQRCCSLLVCCLTVWLFAVGAVAV